MDVSCYNRRMEFLLNLLGRLMPDPEERALRKRLRDPSFISEVKSDLEHALQEGGGRTMVRLQDVFDECAELMEIAPLTIHEKSLKGMFSQLKGRFAAASDEAAVPLADLVQEAEREMETGRDKVLAYVLASALATLPASQIQSQEARPPARVDSSSPLAF